MRFGTFQRPRRSKPLMMANSSVDGAGLHGPPRALVTAPGRSALIRSSSSYVCAAYALVRRSSYSLIGRRPWAAASVSNCATCIRSVSAARIEPFRDDGVLIDVEPTTNAGTCKAVGQTALSAVTAKQLDEQTL